MESAILSSCTFTHFAPKSVTRRPYRLLLIDGKAGGLYFSVEALGGFEKGSTFALGGYPLINVV
jgi:hypothetical protein